MITEYIVNITSTVGSQISNLTFSEVIIFDIALILIVSTILAFIAKVLTDEELSRVIQAKKPDLKKAKEHHLKRLKATHKILY